LPATSSDAIAQVPAVRRTALSDANALADSSRGRPRAYGASDEQTRGRLSWLLFFRSIIITMLLIATVGLRASAGQPLLGTASVVLYVTCGLSYGTILFGALWMRDTSRGGIVPLTYLQLLSDSAVATVLVVATGGFESAFVFLYSLTILNAAAVLGRRAALLMAAANTIIYGGVLGLQAWDQLSSVGLPPQRVIDIFPSFLANVLAFFLVAVLSASLTDQLRRTSLSLDVAQQTLSAVEQVHETILESLPSGVLTVGRDGRITFINRAGAEILGAPPTGDGILDRDLTDVLPDLELADTQGRFEVDRGPSQQVLGGSVADIGDGEAGTAVVFQDLTELRALQGELERAERLQTLGRFAAGMAHELRNPLAAMIGCLQLLTVDAKEGQALTEEGARMLDIIQREAHRLEGLVGDFLTYARPAPPSFSRLPIGPLLDRTVALADATDGVEITVERTPPDVHVIADADQLEQVLWNLVGNACQAVVGEMGEVDDSERGHILVSAEVNEDEVWVHVDDDGPGIAAENLDRIFEPFFTTRPSGTGLGLATSHQLMQAQRGDLSLSPSPLGGARFSLRMVRAAERSGAALEAPDLPDIPAPPPEEPPGEAAEV
jgi:two-component system sensor histidine kinase PilS (NtrC family)